MEQEKQSQKNNNFLPMAVVVVIAIIAIGVYISQQNSPSTIEENLTISEIKTKDAPDNLSSDEILEVSEKEYKDGIYKVSGEYQTPGGQRDIGVIITLENGFIKEASVEVLAKDPTSQRFQKEFAENYKKFVIGKNISELNLEKVAGSPLTPKGFNKALEKIRAEASS